jgi:protein-S-isoprenylcysteine O-methyltransferase Ste14
MEIWHRYGLLGYFALYFFLGFVWRSLLVFRQTGINPIVLPATDDAYGYVGRAFKLAMLACMGVVLTITFVERADVWLGSYPALQAPALRLTGWVLLLLALVWLLVAQAQMGIAWRVGIDAHQPTPLVQHGLFSRSRNPIFLSMRVALLGLVLVVPSAATLVLLVAGELLMQVQVRLEEQHLSGLHGERYAAYCDRVRRWL